MSEPIDGPWVRATDLSSTGFSVRSERRGGGVVVWLQGELDMATAGELRRALTAELDREPGAVAVDLTELSFVDSSGIGALVVASRQASDGGCAFVLHCPGRAVRRALQLTGVDGLLEIEDRPPGR